MFSRSINIVSSSGRLGGGVDVVVGGIGGANVKDRALGLTRGVNISVADMSSLLDSFGLFSPVIGS